jgi:hypothetical protein
MKLVTNKFFDPDPTDVLKTLSPRDLIREAGRDFGLKLKVANILFIELDEYYRANGNVDKSTALNKSHIQARRRAKINVIEREYLGNPQKSKEEVKELFEEGFRRAIIAPQAE